MDININIQTTQFNELGEKNIIKTNSDGTLYQKKDHKYIIYKQVEDGEEITTSIKIEENMVTIKRFGALNSTLRFKAGHVDVSNYLTPQGAFIIENHTKELDIFEGENISILIDYDIKIMDMFTGRNIINIDIKKK
ncbi:MAG: DUF1934 domain-containing protein [Clostridiales bacterium]|uniref:DUF1934 domain-containing protein n=1 Tax=Clostridia TaxID=186801 RepID=UPI0025FCF82E|nr:DUF1934 domain-containing protein [uncultured Intestinibacter sp.]MDU1203228.1 DUF1934 domain-containing protein [Clostridiales bacterium]